MRRGWELHQISCAESLKLKKFYLGCALGCVAILHEKEYTEESGTTGTSLLESNYFLPQVVDDPTRNAMLIDLIPTKREGLDGDLGLWAALALMPMK